MANQTSWKDTVFSLDNWLRGLYMVFFAVINYIIRLLIGLMAVFQFVVLLVQGRPHEKLLNLGRGLSTYAYQIMLFLTFNSEEKPYPFADWPTTSENKKLP